MVWLIVIAAFLLIVTLLNWRTARPDGEFLGKIPSYRKVMLYIMPTRNESVVYYDDYAVADELERTGNLGPLSKDERAHEGQQQK